MLTTKKSVSMVVKFNILQYRRFWKRKGRRGKLRERKAKKKKWKDKGRHVEDEEKTERKTQEVIVPRGMHRRRANLSNAFAIDLLHDVRFFSASHHLSYTLCSP